MSLFAGNILMVTLVAMPLLALAGNELVIIGKTFSVPATQQIQFVPLRKIDPKLYQDPSIPKEVNLREFQSKVKLQGARGACTYFVITSLIESLIKKETGIEVDLSEEYLAWSAKTKLKLRSLEEDSSVAVNALATQETGFMYEHNLPYQQSWFDEGLPCAGKRESTKIDPLCYSHSGPEPEQTTSIRSGKVFEFHDIGSSSLEVVKEIAKLRVPVTVSILAHPRTWDDSKKSGDLFLTELAKKHCGLNPKVCSGHAALIIGYSLKRRVFYFKNSWGERWGDKGYGTIPFDYLDQMSDRRFLIGKVVGPIKL